MGFFHLALKNMTRHRTRTCLTMLSIFISVAVLYAVVSYNHGFSGALQRELGSTGVHVTLVPTGCPHEAATVLLQGSALPGSLTRDAAAGIQELVGDRAARFFPILITQAHSPQKENLVLVYGLDRTGMAEFKPGWHLMDGEFPSSDRGIVLGRQVALMGNFRVGDTIQYMTGGYMTGGTYESGSEAAAGGFVRVEEGLIQTFYVSGILEKTGTQDDATVFAPLPVARMITGQAEGMTALGIQLDAPETARSISRELESAFSGIQAVTPDRLMETVTSVVQSARVLSFSMVVLVVIISASGVMNSVLMTVFERTREIGAMRAIGASRFDIFRITMNEAFILTAVGGLAGILAVSLFAPLIENLVRHFLPYAPQGQNLVFNPLIALACLLFSMLTGVVAGLLPAWKASRISPIEAMRN